MLQLVDVSKRFGPRVLFEGVSWHVGPGERVGLVGPNGVGKTTLLKVLTGELEAEAGKVVIQKHLQVGSLAQEVGDFGGRTPLEVVADASHELASLEVEKTSLESALAAGAHDPDTVERYAWVQDRFHHLGGYSREAEAKKLLAGLGFSPIQMTGPAAALSGGERMRVALARLLMQAPDLLLLDEPTNHLDMETLEWFEGFLRNYQGTLIAVSHDRYFLDRVATSIADLGPRGVEVYPGSYTAYREARAERRERQAAAHQRQEKEVAQVERFIERFRAKASKASAVQSRVTQLGKLDRIEAPEADRRAIRFRFPKPERSGRDVVSAVGVGLAYGDRVVYRDLDLVLRRGERVALVGPNGAGKSTLLKLLAGTLGPTRGEVRLGHQATRGYFAQHQLEALDPGRTVLEQLLAVARVDQHQLARDLLGAFLFSGQDVGKRVEVLSGGEKARLALCRLLLRPPNLLLMDEPTNHLDLQSREVLEAALADFEGTLVVVSHDRSFIQAVANLVLEVRHGEVRRFEGSYDYYLAKRAELEQASSEAPGGAPQGDALPRARKLERRLEADRRNAWYREVKPLHDRTLAVEERITLVEAELKQILERQADTALYGDRAALQEILARQASLQADQETLLLRWEELAAETERAEAAFAAAWPEGETR
jgi:ATP-binding cassette subfamily F protein 3